MRAAWPAGLPERVELGDVPFFPQKDYQCGPAALATTLAYFNVKVTPEDLVEQVYLPARQGSLQIEMLATARRHGMVSYQLAPRFEDLLREVAAGNPVIVLQDYGVSWFTLWHYAVVVLNNLAQILSDQNRDEEALALIERAVALGGPLADAARDTRELILRRMKVSD